MKEKLVVMCLKLSVAFEVIAEFIAYPDNRDKERKVSCFGFESEFWWQIGVIGFVKGVEHNRSTIWKIGGY